MTYKELVGYINEEIAHYIPDSGFTILTSKPDTDADSTFNFYVTPVLSDFTGTLECSLKFICSFPVDTEGNLLDVLDAVISAVVKNYKPTAEGYIVGAQVGSNYSYTEIPTMVYYDADQQEQKIELPLVAREYHRVEIPVGFYFSLEYAVTEEPTEDTGGDGK